MIGLRISETILQLKDYEVHRYLSHETNIVAKKVETLPDLRQTEEWKGCPDERLLQWILKTNFRPLSRQCYVLANIESCFREKRGDKNLT